MRAQRVEGRTGLRTCLASGLESEAKIELDIAIISGASCSVEPAGQEVDVPWSSVILRVQIGVIQQVKELAAEFDALRLLDRKDLVYGEIDVLEAGAAAGISAHVPVRVDVRAND